MLKYFILFIKQKLKNNSVLLRMKYKDKDSIKNKKEKKMRNILKILKSMQIVKKYKNKYLTLVEIFLSLIINKNKINQLKIETDHIWEIFKQKKVQNFKIRN